MTSSRLNFSSDIQWQAFQARVYEPWVALAEKVGSCEGDFAKLRDERGGFDPETRFILDHDLNCDPEAGRLKRSILEAMKRMWGLDYDPSAPLMDEEWLNFFSARTFVDPSISSGPSSMVRGADFDSRLEFFFYPVFEQLGFTRDRQRSKGNLWRCETEIEGRRVQVIFEKEEPPSYRASGSFFLVEFDRIIPLAYPFFFSGGPHFHYSKADDLTAQLRRFFEAYQKIIADVGTTLETSIAAGNEYLRTVRRSD